MNKKVYLLSPPIQRVFFHWWNLVECGLLFTFSSFLLFYYGKCALFRYFSWRRSVCECVCMYMWNVWGRERESVCVCVECLRGRVCGWVSEGQRHVHMIDTLCGLQRGIRAVNHNGSTSQVSEGTTLASSCDCAQQWTRLQCTVDPSLRCQINDTRLIKLEGMKQVGMKILNS